MKILVFGGTGMLGHKLVEVLGNEHEVFSVVHKSISEYPGHPSLTPSHIFDNFDAASQTQLEEILRKVKPEVVLNAIGTIKQKAVGSNDVIRMLETNSVFPQRLGTIAEGEGFRLITFSTDCVFSGTKGNYNESDVPDATDIYGQSKRWGEVINENSLTIRTSIIGRELSTRFGLVEWFLSQSGSSAKGYTKAIFSGFPTLVLADIILFLIRDFPDLSGLYHLSSDPITKFDLLGLVNNTAKANVRLIPDTEYVIDRSLDSTRFRKMTIWQPPPWPEMVDRMCSEFYRYSKY